MTDEEYVAAIIEGVRATRARAAEFNAEVERAIELDPNNTQVRQNYELFKEINDRTNSAKDKS